MTDQPTAAIVSQRARVLARQMHMWAQSTSLSAHDAEELSTAALLTYRAENEAATIERCAGVAASYPNTHAHGPAITPERHRLDIATAIRNLKGQAL